MTNHTMSWSEMLGDRTRPAKAPPRFAMMNLERDEDLHIFLSILEARCKRAAWDEEEESRDAIHTVMLEGDPGAHLDILGEWAGDQTGNAMLVWAHLTPLNPRSPIDWLDNLNPIESQKKMDRMMERTGGDDSHLLSLMVEGDLYHRQGDPFPIPIIGLVEAATRILLERDPLASLEASIRNLPVDPPNQTGETGRLEVRLHIGRPGTHGIMEQIARENPGPEAKPREPDEPAF